MEAEPCNVSDTCTDCDACETVECAPIILSAIDFLKSYELRGGVRVDEMVDINPIKSCDTAPDYSASEVDKDFQSLTILDLGDDNSLALVQAQYPSYKVIRIERNGMYSVYQVLTADGVALTDYSTSLASLLKGCEDCPSGYTATVGGVLYAVSIEDEGASLVTTVDDLPGFVTGTCVKQGQDGGIGMYTLVLDNKLTQAEIDTFHAASAPKRTAKIEYVATTEEFCTNATTVATAWVVGDSCTVAEDRYTIIVPDTQCGASRLAELQAAYPDLTIAIDTELTSRSSRAITLTGTGGTANIDIDGTDYLVTFDTDLTETADDFVDTHAAALLALGITVTADAGVLTFVHATTGFPTIEAPVNATLDLAGTIAALTAIPTDITGNCSTQYTTDVVTSLVCDECDDAFKALYTSVPPGAFDIYEWTKVEPTPDYSGCLCGIKFKGKVTEIKPDEFLKDTMAYLNTSVKIEVSGGYIIENTEGTVQTVENPFKVQYLSRWTPKTHDGGNYWNNEKQSNYFFNGEDFAADYKTRLFKGQQSSLKAGTQYIDYMIDIRNTNYSNSMSQRHELTTTYHILVELGRQTNVEALVNMIAGAAGIAGVKA
jgi:hypothetical protein